MKKIQSNGRLAALFFVVIFLFVFASSRLFTNETQNMIPKTFAAADPLAASNPSAILGPAIDFELIPRPDGSVKPTDWHEWQSELRQTLAEQIFEVGAESDVVHSHVSSVDQSRNEEIAFSRTELWIPSRGGHHIPAVLLRPRTNTKLPAVLMIPGHVNPGQSGLVQMTEEIDSYHNSAAVELAKAGYTTLTIELRGFGLLGPPNFPDHTQVAFNAILAGHFYKKIAIHDVKNAFEYLRSLDGVDSSRVAIAGVSLGAELAVAYAGIDERVRAVVSHGYGGSVGRFLGIQNFKASGRHYCHVVPGSRRIYRKEDVFFLLAPRPTLIVRGVEDAPLSGEFAFVVTKLWENLGAPSNLFLLTLSGESDFSGHAFFVEQTIYFLDDYL